jgi:hypothetical protein
MIAGYECIYQVIGMIYFFEVPNSEALSFGYRNLETGGPNASPFFVW